MAEVRLVNVTKKYGPKLAIEDLSFENKEGDFFSIVGPAGAGKSTILKMVAGLEPITSGEIYFNNRLVNGLSPKERNVAMAFETYNLYSHFNVYENIAFPLRAPERNEKLTKGEERKRVEEVADFLGIKRLLDRKPVQLSGGEKQRVCLSRAMVRRCECFLLDEPIAHLDARLKLSTQVALKRLSVKLGTAIIYVTHDYREALGMSDRMAVLRKGRFEQLGTPEEIYKNPATDFVANFIGDPPCNLIDGRIVGENGNISFRVDQAFSIPLAGPVLAKAEAMVQKTGDTNIRLGIRPARVKVSSEKTSDRCFEMPIYAIVRRPQSTVITFDLEDRFFRASVNEYLSNEMSERVWIDFNPDYMSFFQKTIEISK
jgi:ABC-type sugar transport system ATPase subunit